MKYAVCNELFGNRPLGYAAGIVKETGYNGIEFAPYTIFGDFTPSEIRSGVKNVRMILDDTGLVFAGFHWLLVGPAGLHITTPDRDLRRKSWEHLRRLIDAAALLGGGPLILGSPRQRSATGGITREEATAILAEELAAIAPFAAAGGSPILLEALQSDQSDVVNTLAQARRLIEAIDSPGVAGMFDFHNTGDEEAAWEDLIVENAAIITHVHANEMNGEFPGTGNSDYAPAVKALCQISFTGWVSMEIFSTPAEPAGGLRDARELFRKLEVNIPPDCGGKSFVGGKKGSAWS